LGSTPLWDKRGKELPFNFQYTVRGLGKLLQKEGKKMYNNYPNYYPQVQTQRPMVPSLKGRPVSSLDEVRAMSVDFDGSMFFFPDLANKRIYTK